MPEIRRCGHSSARSRRSVISAASRFMWLWTLPITKSSSASASSARSIAPSRRMSHSMPEKTRMPRLLPVQLAHLLRERDGARFVQAVGHGERLRMVRDRDVLVARAPCGFGHFFESRASVGLAWCACAGRRGYRSARPALAAGLRRRPRSRRSSRAAPAESSEPERLVDLLLGCSAPRARRPRAGTGRIR